jgi:hypothetical protein
MQDELDDYLSTWPGTVTLQLINSEKLATLHYNKLVDKFLFYVRPFNSHPPLIGGYELPKKLSEEGWKLQ